MQARIRSLLAIAIVAASFSAAAAENPKAATAETSSGNFKITMNLKPFIVVNHFDNLELTVNPATNAVGIEEVCVGGYGFPDYDVSFTSANSAATGLQFALMGDSEFVPYKVQFIDNTVDAAGHDVDSTGTTAESYDRNATASDCLTGEDDNARIFISVDAGNWQNISENSLTDTLTLVVSAN